MAKKCQCEEGAPLWLQTYGDMVTLMLCLFVMIYTTGKSTPNEIQLILSAFSNSLGFFDGGQTLSKGRMEDMGMNLESLPSQTTGRSLSNAKKQAMSIFKPEIKAQKVRVQEDERGLVISLVSEDYFEPGSARLTAPMEEVLTKASGLLKSVDRYVRVEGFTSKGEEDMLSREQSGERVYASSWDLSSARSVNCVSYLQDRGVEPSNLSAVGYGSFRPMSREDQGTPEAEAHNRRIDIVIMPYKDPKRGAGESFPGLPSTRIPGFENQTPDR